MFRGSVLRLESVNYMQRLYNAFRVSKTLYYVVYISNQMHKSQSLFYLTTALHVSGVTITHLQEHKTTVTTASGNYYTVTDRVKFTDKEYRQTGLKLQLNNVYSAENAISSIE